MAPTIEKPLSEGERNRVFAGRRMGLRIVDSSK